MTRVKTFLSALLLSLAASTAYAQFPVQTIGSILPRETTDSLTALDDCTIPTPVWGFSGYSFTVSGTWSATITFQVSSDGTNYFAINAAGPTSTTPGSTTTINGTFQGSFTGATHIRACATAFASGIAVVTTRAVLAGGTGGGGGGGGSVTQFAEDAAHTTGDAGVQILAVRNDAGAALATTTGDYIPLTTDSTGALRVAAVAAAGGTSSNFGAAFPAAGTAIGFTDGTNMVAARAFDVDTGAGTWNVQLSNNVFRTSGTPVEAGTSANPWNVVFPSAQAVTQSGTWNVGTLTTVTNPVAVTQSGAWTNNVGTFPDNEPFNIAQMNGVAVTMGNGASGTGVQRVTIASDSTGTVAATQSTAANLNAQVVGVAAHDAAASGNPLQMAGIGNSGIPTAVSTNGDVTRIWTSLFGAPNVIIRDSAGDSAMDDTNNALRVNIIAGAGSGGTALADDAAFTVAVSSYTPIGGTFKSTLDAVDDGDGGAFAMTARRALHASFRRESDGAEWGIAATAPLAFRPSDGTNFLSFASDATHDSAVETAGPQSMLGAVADVSAQTPVANGDAVRQVADVLGRSIMIMGCDRSAAVGGVTTITDGSSTAATGLGAQGASIFNEVRTVTIVNTSTTPVSVDMRDGVAGSVLWTFPVPAATGQTHGGVTMNFDVPRYGTSNTAIAFDPSAAATSIIISASGCKVK